MRKTADMTTENQNMDAAGAEANKPQNQDATNQNPQDTSTPRGIVEQRLAEINNRDQVEQESSAAEPPKEQQPEIKPESTTAAEETTVFEREEVMANAILNTEEPETSAPEVPLAQATKTEEAAPVVNTTEQTSPQSAPVAQANNLHEEDEEEHEEHEEADYSQFSIDELRSQLNSILKGADARKRGRVINELQRHYELKFNAEKQEALERFKEESGSEEGFAYHAPKEHQDIENLLTAYREARYHERQNQEEQRQRNLERKQELLSRLRQLVESAETKSSSDELKKLQVEWKEIGPVPAGEAQELWNSYHALLDIFYNNRSIFFELKELDRKRNLDAKLQLIERAQALANEPSINKALQELRHLHDEWKNIGPVPNDQRDPIWERFINASEKIHEHRRSYQEQRREQETVNLTKKRALLEQLMGYQDFKTDRINDWRDKTDEIQKLKEEWDAAGLVPKEYAEEINKSFWTNYKAFFQHKNQFFKSLDEQKMQNLRLKTELCEEAESLKESEDWNATKEKLIQLQKKWKTIGRVPDKHSDKIWQRFRSACNEFFDRKQSHEQVKTAEIEKQSAEKYELCDRISEKLSQPNTTATVQEYNVYVEQWRALDTNKRSSAKLEEKFLALMEKFLERVTDLSAEERTSTFVKLQVERLKHSPDASQKLQQKEHSIRREITQLQNDIQTLKTNIEFFANSKNANKLREEYEGRITEAQTRIDMLYKQWEAYRG
ncbi:DUF349 domain-containing protein [Pontibacter harenae]|uniref:DUF349 domain-containing protein n=1 Tax=Pontibacter harenae TaxID=2894083 RepID=UPI001E5F3442|nr:DUF349 domain-containing protein [Pontibacter harenae]MCC9167077.1 DUF349 domain-containing protein [Pontibacter harenae]